MMAGLKQSDYCRWRWQQIIRSLDRVGGPAGFDLETDLGELVKFPEVLALVPAEFLHAFGGGLLDEVVVLGLGGGRGTMWQLSLRAGAEVRWVWLA